MNRCGSLPLLSAPHSLASEQFLIDLKRSQGHQRGGEEVDLANWALQLDDPSHADLRRSCAERIFTDLSACARFTLFSDRWGLRSSLQCRKH